MRWFRKPRTLGQQGEDIAARFLKKSGFTILERNVILGRYEIDIIAQEGDTVAFVEVKTRKSDAFAPPEVNVTRKKQIHIRKAAHRYIDKHDDGETYYRFDIVTVVLGDSKPRVTLFRNAFQDE